MRYGSDALRRVFSEFIGATPPDSTRHGYGIDATAQHTYLEVTDESGKKQRTYTDVFGNTVTAPAPYAITAVTYEPSNLPLSLTRSGNTTTYRYNEAGQRLAKQVGVGTGRCTCSQGRTPSAS